MEYGLNPYRIRVIRIMWHVWAYHIHKDATARYAPYLRHVQLPTYKLSLAARVYGQWLIEDDLNN